jgi:hypothetical protein
MHRIDNCFDVVSERSKTLRYLSLAHSLAVYVENDFSPLVRCAGEHLVSSAHVVQRQDGAYLRGQLSTVKQPRNTVQPFRSHLSVEKYRAHVGSLRCGVSGHDRNKDSTGIQGAV